MPMDKAKIRNLAISLETAIEVTRTVNSEYAAIQLGKWTAENILITLKELQREII